MYRHYVIVVRPVAVPAIKCLPEQAGLQLSTATHVFDQQQIAIDFIFTEGCEQPQPLDTHGLLAFIDGYILARDPAGPATLSDTYLNFLNFKVGTDSLPSGLYNLFLFSPERRELAVFNDLLGALPCYYTAQQERLIFSSSLYLLHRLAPLTVSPQGFGERFVLGHTLNDATIFDSVWRTLPGTAYTFSLTPPYHTASRRLSRAWTYTDQRSKADLHREFAGLLSRAFDRSVAHFGSPVGIMLSGGLDSRWVAGELARRGVEIIGCTHGDPASVEWQIARQVADQLDIRLLENPMDEDFSFDALSLDELLRQLDYMSNPIWQRSRQMLHEAGVTNITTGTYTDVSIGGTGYFDVKQKRERFLLNLRTACGLFFSDEHADGETIAALGNLVHNAAAKRHRHYTRLLKPEYRSMCEYALEHVRARAIAIGQQYISEGRISFLQAVERMHMEHTARKVTGLQELVLRQQGEAITPMTDGDLLSFCFNMRPQVKFDHHFYYPAFRRSLPDLARIPVPNLYGGVANLQIVIELRRAAHQAAGRFRAQADNARPRTWVNFDSWIRRNNHIDRYKAEFLQHENIFDPDTVTDYFEAVRRGERSLYDGDETLNFLSMARLVDI